MQDHERAYNDQYKVSWSNVESARIDTKRMKEEEPILYQKFLKVGHSRRFQIKAR